MFLEVALDFIKTSNCLQDLTICMSNTEAKAGRDFLEALANEVECDTLQNLDLNCPESEKMACKWFQQQDEPVEALIEFVKRQPGLKSLNVVGCMMNDDQKQRVRTSCPYGCNVWFTKAEKDEWDDRIMQQVNEQVAPIQKELDDEKEKTTQL